MIKVYTDGGLSKKNNVGGWAAVIVQPNGDRQGIKGHYRGEDVTNNKMEMKAIIEGLKFVAYHHPGEKIQVISDSEYIVKGINEWSETWIRKGWKTTTGPVKNVPLWVEILGLVKLTEAEITWVRGHDGDENNEIADKLCVGAYKELLK
jgi:ribonuclease HI